jgi:hypothetical protein
MNTIVEYPKIKRVETRAGKRILVEFANGVYKIYDCTPLLQSEVFRPLQDEAVFRCARADAQGYGVVWNDDIDLAESEIWINGQDAEPSGAAHPARRGTSGSWKGRLSGPGR